MYIMIGLFTGDMIQNIIDFSNEYRKPWDLFKKREPLAGMDEDESERHDPNYVAPHTDTAIGGFLHDIGKFMDKMETDNGDVTAITQM